VNATVRHRATTIQQKTEQPVQFELTEQTRDSLLAWLTHRGGSLDDYVFPAGQGQASTSAPASMPVLSANGSRRSGSARSAYGTHSLRRTKVALIYKRTGNLRAVQILLGHTKLGKHGTVPGR
jgi:site-specific recombinase XerC